jgi:subtilisin family serine protease
MRIVLRSWRALALVLVILVAAGGAGAAGDSGSVPARPPAAGGGLGAGLASGSYTITLLTGDRITLHVDGAGRSTAHVQAAERPDGSQPAVEVTGSDDALYAVPDDVRPFLDSGRLDRELFNLNALAANGYARGGSLPVIVEYPPTLRAAEQRERAQALPASGVTHALESVDAVALQVSRSDAEAFWAELKDGTGAKKIWLDHRVEVELDQSVPQIGAPAAWAAGYDGTGIKVAVLDTGIDAAHPDVAGKVVASRSFITGQEVADGHGHGTHVAATVAGSGAGRGGTHKGVAPGADLVIGKVLANSGSGPMSRIIDGMEWAALEQGADVINMSLSATGGDGTDPASRAVNELTEQTGALFVVAGGNSGPGPVTLGTPGVANAALTVAAVDKSGLMAGFSSRGPRAGDGALKPDIAAPGVGIVAARASGTGMGSPVDALYTSANGTSMAAPHVAGAAAILAQARSGWTPGQLKAALMSTAAEDGHDVYERGAGSLDVARAVRQQVFATTPSADFKVIRPPFDDDALSRTITYANHGDAPVTLALAPELRTEGGATAPAGALTVPSSLTVPAAGTAAVEITLDPAGLTTGRYSGAIVATGPGGVRLSTPVGLAVGPQLYDVTVNLLRRQRDAGPWRAVNGVSDACANVGVTGVDGPGVDMHVSDFGCWDEPAPREHPVTFQLPAGTYSVWGLHDWHDGNRYRHANLHEPEFEVTGDTEITLDADRAEPITIDTPLRSEVVDQVLSGTRTTTSGTSFHYFRTSTHKGKPVLWVTPTSPVTKGEFAFTPHHVLAAPAVEATVTRPSRMELHPYPAHLVGGVRSPVPFSGERTRSVVYAGDGSAEEFAEIDARGKLVILRVQPVRTRAGEIDPGAWPFPWIHRPPLERAIEAGAAGVLIHSGEGILTEIRMSGENCSPTSCSTSNTPPPRIPFALLPAPEADRLIELLDRGRVELRLKGTPPDESPYMYSLKPYDEGHVPARPHYRIERRDLMRLDAGIHRDEPSASNLSFVTRRNIDGLFAFVPGHGTTGPRTLPIYAGPLYGDAVHEIHERPATGGDIEFAMHALTRDDARDVQFRAGPIAPGVEYVPAGINDHPLAVCTACRQGDAFYPLMPLVSPERHRRGGVLGTSGAGIHLYRDDVEIPRGGVLGVGYDLPPERARYRLTVDTASTRSAWEFTSGAVTNDENPHNTWCAQALTGVDTTPCRAEPLLFLAYDAGVRLDNTVRAGRSDEIRVNVHRQAPTGARIAGLRLWVSTDDGAEWDEARVRSRGNGIYEADVRYPRLSRTTGAVSIRAEAWDADGNRVEQTLTRAYRLGEGEYEDDDDSDD